MALKEKVYRKFHMQEPPKLFFENYENMTLEAINKDQEVTLTENDYDFKAWRPSSAFLIRR
jgi:hypothetical protein